MKDVINFETYCILIALPKQKTVLKPKHMGQITVKTNIIDSFPCLDGFLAEQNSILLLHNMINIVNSLKPRYLKKY